MGARASASPRVLGGTWFRSGRKQPQPSPASAGVRTSPVTLITNELSGTCAKRRPKGFRQPGRPEHVVRAAAPSAQQKSLHHAYFHREPGRGPIDHPRAHFSPKCLNCEPGLTHSRAAKKCSAASRSTAGFRRPARSGTRDEYHKVDEMRAVARDGANAHGGRFKGYVIDEVHHALDLGFSTRC